MDTHMDCDDTQHKLRAALYSLAAVYDRSLKEPSLLDLLDVGTLVDVLSIGIGLLDLKRSFDAGDAWIPTKRGPQSRRSSDPEPPGRESRSSDPRRSRPGR